MDDISMSRELANRALQSPALLTLQKIGPEDVLAAFLAGKNRHTLAAYDADLRDFARFLDLDPPKLAVAALVTSARGDAHAIALAWRVHLQARDLAPATIARKLAALRSIVKLAGQLGQVDWELTITSPRGDSYRDTAGPGEEGWKAVRDKAKADAAAGSPIGLRDLAIVRLLHDLALRREEACRLDLADVDLNDLGEPFRVWILGKRRAQKESLTLPRPTSEAIAAWIVARGPQPGPLFNRLDLGASGSEGSRLTGRSVANIVQRLGERSGLRRRLRPHGLRHQAITEALDRTNGDVRKVQRFSRHADLKTLVVYDDKRKDGAGEVSRLIADD